MYKIVYVIYVWCFFVIGQTSPYQKNAQLSFKSLSVNNGLSQRSVTSIVQDNQGFMWFGTRYGLNKYDGYSIKNYYYNAKQTHSLSNNWITALTKDAKDSLWVGTKNGLNKYDAINDQFIRVVKTDTQSYYNEEIWDIKIKDSAAIWIATNNGLHKFNIETNTVFEFKNDPNNSFSISSNQVRSLCVANKNQLWIATTKSIDVFDEQSNTFTHYTYPNNNTPENVKTNAVIIFQDTSGNIWLGYEKGLALFDTASKSFKDFTFDDASKLINHAVRDLHQDANGVLWIGTYQGLYGLNLKEQRLEKYVNDPKNESSLSQNSVYKISGDKRGDLWIGTWAGGVNYLNKKQNTFNSFHSGIYNTNLNYPVVSAVLQDKKEQLWVCTEGGGINILDKKTGTFSYLTHNPRNPKSISGNNVKAIIQDHKNHFWIGTHGEGLNKITYDGKILTNTIYKSDPQIKNSLSDNSINCLLEDSSKAIWIGTESGELNIFNPKTEVFNTVKDPQNLIGNNIYALLEYNNDALLIGCANGLVWLNKKNKQLSAVAFRESPKTVYRINNVISLFKASDDKLWIGTEGDGLYEYDINTKKSTHYGVLQGLPDEVIYGILSDKNGKNLWVSTNKGLIAINLETKKTKSFNRADGIQGNEFNYGAYSSTKNGHLIFGGIHGFTLFNSSEIIDDNFAPSVVINSIKAREEELTNPSANNKLLQFTYLQNDINFNFVALGYAKPYKKQYAYKLEGLDKNWNYTQNRTATYTNLDFGNYTFKVKASNSDGVWNGEVTSISLKISPPFWKTKTAYVVYFLILLGTFFLVRRLVLIRIIERNTLRQERLEKAKIKELNKLKLQLFTNISHDFRTPLTLIIGPLQQLIKGNKTSGYVHEKLLGIYRNSNVLLQLINQLLDFRKAESGKLKLHITKNNIVLFLNEVMHSFDELANERHIDFTFHFSKKNIAVWFDNIEMRKVIFNILSNSFKFTPEGGKISIKIQQNNSREVQIVIEDTGEGIPEKDIEFVFDRYFQLGQHNQLRSGTGVGLAVAKDIVDLHQGSITVKSSQGTRFTITLPLGKKHLKSEDILESDEDIKNLENHQIDYYSRTLMPLDIDELKPAKNNTQNSNASTILLVEDNDEVRMFIKSIFEENFTVLEAVNGQEGITMAKSHVVDLIISDLMMPVMDGIEMCNRIKSDIETSHIPVVILSARTSAETQLQGFEKGADLYITKPFNAELLSLQVLNFMDSRKVLIEKFKKDVLLSPKELSIVSEDEALLKKAIGIIEDNMADSGFNVSVFVANMGMSQSALYKKIKGITGQSITEFIRTIRIKRASQLLVDSTMNVSEIAYNTGFNDLKYFRKCFKTIFKASPAQYREEQQKLFE